MIESYKWDWIGNLCRHWFLEHRFAVPITAFFNCLPSSSSSSSASSSPSSSPSAGLPSTGAIESKQPRLRSKTAKELQIIKKNIKDLSVNERWLPIKCLKADCTIDKLANVALTWNYCQLIQLHYNYITTERWQDANYLEINSNTIHKKFYLSFIALFKDALLGLTVVGFCEGNGRGVSL